MPQVKVWPLLGVLLSVVLLLVVRSSVVIFHSEQDFVPALQVDLIVPRMMSPELTCTGVL